jgi:hypothetical protein
MVALASPPTSRETKRIALLGFHQMLVEQLQVALRRVPVSVRGEQIPLLPAGLNVGVADS